MTRGFEVVRDDCRKFPQKEIKLPTRGTSKAAAYDFYANDTYSVEPGKIVKIWTDVKAYMQDNDFLMLDVRSSMGGKYMLANTIGIVDGDYFSNESNDGNIGIFLKNISQETLTIFEGDRIAQGIFMKYLVADNGNTDEIRKGGFGSTGVK